MALFKAYLQFRMSKINDERFKFFSFCKKRSCDVALAGVHHLAAVYFGFHINPPTQLFDALHTLSVVRASFEQYSASNLSATESCFQGSRGQGRFHDCKTNSQMTNFQLL